MFTQSFCPSEENIIKALLNSQQHISNPLSFRDKLKIKWDQRQQKEKLNCDQTDATLYAKLPAGKIFLTHVMIYLFTVVQQIKHQIVESF